MNHVEKYIAALVLLIAVFVLIGIAKEVESNHNEHIRTIDEITR